MDKLTVLGFVFIIISLVGFYLAYLYGRRTKRFRWREYIAIIILPLLSVVLLGCLLNQKILGLFLISAFIGFIFEYIVGLTYYKTLNKRLWIYECLSVGCHSSFFKYPPLGNCRSVILVYK